MPPRKSTTPRVARASPRQAAPSTPTSIKSSRSKATSTPLKQLSTPTRSGRIGKKAGTTSPYFSKTKAKTKATTNGSRGRAKVEEEDSPTGMTSSESPSSSSEDDGSEDNFDPSSDDEDVEAEEEEVLDESEEADSEDIDDEEFGKKRKSGGGSSRPKKKVKKSDDTKKNGNGKHTQTVEGYEDEDDDDDIELEEGQEIAGRIYPAPKTGQVPPGRISQNTLNFLKNMQIPERNDRDWFRSHEPAFRQAEKEWQAFVGLVQLKFHEADDEVPILPPRDIIHRIYRDVRFSSDKTPYKKSFSLTTSRGGRKGLWAGYHFSISPNNKTILACGIWQPGKNEMATIRHNLLNDPDRFRREINKKEFVKYFGEGKVHPKGERRSVFGHDDQLKVAPKLEGVDKNHKDIDLLKLRTIAVVHHFTDEQVIDEDFQDSIKDVLVVMAPFVHLLNDYIALPAAPPTATATAANDNDNDDDDEDGDDE